MPGWHAKTKKLVSQNKLQVYGIAPEQYGDRMALFLQWQKLEFPVLMDPLNLLGVSAVPITLLVDESGIIRYRNPRGSDLEKFLATDYPSSKKKRKPSAIDSMSEQMSQILLKQDRNAGTKFLSHTKDRKDLSPTQYFQSGVVARWLYDNQTDPDLFQTAVSQWQSALNKNPRQYIWRRRIQQYGPRLDKPYPFYNWVETARKEVIARGDEPIALAVEPSGSEVAMPLKRNQSKVEALPFPDPDRKLPNSENQLTITSTLIPHTDQSNQFRIHLTLKPQNDGHWSSDAQDISLWLVKQNGDIVFLTDQASSISADRETSDETRTVEADLALSKNGEAKLAVFYSLCSKTDATCRFYKSLRNF